MCSNKNKRNRQLSSVNAQLVDVLLKGGVPKKAALQSAAQILGGGRNKKNRNKKQYTQAEKKRRYKTKKMINGQEVKNVRKLGEENRNNGVPSQDYVDNFVTVSTLDTLAQVPNTVIECHLNTSSLVAAAYQWPGYCMANNVGVNDLVDVPGTGEIGALYFMAAVIAYDLWCGTGGDYSIFAKFPKVYADLRAAIAPTTVNGYKYQFVSNDLFFGPGSMFPTGYPLLMDTVSLAWKTGAAGDLFPVQGLAPILSEDQLRTYGPAVVMDYWTKIVEAENSKHEWIGSGEINVYADRTEAFAQVIDLSGSINYRWCQFALETAFLPGAKWLAYMGFASVTSIGRRAGFNVCANYQTAANYAHRIIDGVDGIKPYDVIIRHKTIDIETMMTSITASAVAADLQYNEVAGTNSIDQVDLKRSVLYNVDAGIFFRAVLATVVQRFAIYNFVGADNSLKDCYVLAGSLWSVTAGSLTNRLPTWICESLSGLQRLDRLRTYENGRTSKVQFVTYPLLVCYGSFGVNGYAPMGDQTNLLSIFNQMYPGYSTISYHFKNPPISSLDPVCNPVDFGYSQVEGDAMPDALRVFDTMWGDLQGNLTVSICTNAVHDKTTFMHMTRMLETSDTVVGPKEDRIQELIVEEGGKKNIKLVAAWSPIYLSTVTEIRCRFKFTSDRIAWILTRVLPMSFLPDTDYATIYHEKFASIVSFGGIIRYLDFGTRTAFSVAHPIAGSGDEQTIGDQKRVEMGIGGGFFDVVGNLLGKLFT